MTRGDGRDAAGPARLVPRHRRHNRRPRRRPPGHRRRIQPPDHRLDGPRGPDLVPRRRDLRRDDLAALPERPARGRAGDRRGPARDVRHRARRARHGGLRRRQRHHAASFDGVLDETRIWSAARSAVEIRHDLDRAGRDRRPAPRRGLVDGRGRRDDPRRRLRRPPRRRPRRAHPDWIDSPIPDDTVPAAPHALAAGTAARRAWPSPGGRRRLRPRRLQRLPERDEPRWPRTASRSTGPTPVTARRVRRRQRSRPGRPTTTP